MNDNDYIALLRRIATTLNPERRAYCDQIITIYAATGISVHEDLLEN